MFEEEKETVQTQKKKCLAPASSVRMRSSIDSYFYSVASVNSENVRSVRKV